jgi:hypothetical protein
MLTVTENQATTDTNNAASQLTGQSYPNGLIEAYTNDAACQQYA